MAMTNIPNSATLGRLGVEVERCLPDFMDDLEAIVNIESGSYTRTGVDQVVSWMADRLGALGATIERHANDELADTIVATFTRDTPGPTVMLIGHADTVFDPGYLARRPFEIRDDEILGPGVSDMKSGLLVGAEMTDETDFTAYTVSWNGIIFPGNLPPDR